MIHLNHLTSTPFITTALKKRILFGVGIASILISCFLISAGKGNPAWGNFWQLKPMLLTPILGGAVGLCYDLTERLRKLDGWLGRTFFVLSWFGYVIGLWMAMVLGMAGSLWD